MTLAQSAFVPVGSSSVVIELLRYVGVKSLAAAWSPLLEVVLP